MPPLSDPTEPPHPGDGHQREQPPPADMSPIVPGRAGRPNFSLEALRERVEQQFHEETAHRTDILLDLDTEEKRLDLLREVADYVCAVEAVTLSERDLTALLDRAYRNLFTFGPLDEYLRDDEVTEIAINGPYAVSVRHGMGRLEPVSAAFDDRADLEAMLERVLATGGATPTSTEPISEVGVVMLGRAARITLAAPPVSPDYSLEIRLHPRQPIMLDDLGARFDVLPPQAAALLKAILARGHGLLIVGDVALGKTTLASALVHALAAEGDTGPRILAVERAAELHLPPGVRRRTVIPPTPEDPGSDFGSQIQAALDERPDWMVVDEIRGDESAAVWDALTRENPPCYLWVFRGDPQPVRLRSALSMVIRLTHPGVAQEAIHYALVQRLPFVAALRRVGGMPRLDRIAEWVPGASGDAPPDLRPILVAQGDGWQFTGYRPARSLDLPGDVWSFTD
jgi:type IV secretory pathway ATPase VirB11/archaellum biosynthesis ATPase